MHLCCLTLAFAPGTSSRSSTGASEAAGLGSPDRASSRHASARASWGEGQRRNKQTKVLFCGGQQATAFVHLTQATCPGLHLSLLPEREVLSPLPLVPVLAYPFNELSIFRAYSAASRTRSCSTHARWRATGGAAARTPTASAGAPTASSETPSARPSSRTSAAPSWLPSLAPTQTRSKRWPSEAGFGASSSYRWQLGGAIKAIANYNLKLL